MSARHLKILCNWVWPWMALQVGVGERVWKESESQRGGEAGAPREGDQGGGSIGSALFSVPQNPPAGAPAAVAAGIAAGEEAQAEQTQQLYLHLPSSSTHPCPPQTHLPVRQPSPPP